MKKFYTFASTLMLALSMALMTACSNENDLVIDKPVVPEQPAEGSRIVTLKATANMGADTRVVTEDVAGTEDAFRITGWKNDEVVRVLAYAEGYVGGTLEVHLKQEIPFTHSAGSGEFTGSVPETFRFLSSLRGAYVGGSVTNPVIEIIDNTQIDINVPFAITNPEDCFLFGLVDNDGESISANLSAPYALACVHNYTGRSIEVGLTTNADKFITGGLKYRYSTTGNSFKFGADFITDDASADKYTVPAGEKVYFVIPPKDGEVTYGLYDFTNDRTIAEPKDVTLGKVYKVQVNNPVTGTAKANIKGTQIDVKWFQLWADGPKFAECNVGVPEVDPAWYGGCYCWGDDWDQQNYGIYKCRDFTFPLDYDYDTAIQIWGDNWRMPTKDELDGLFNSDKCTSKWVADYKGTGVPGRLYTGKGAYSGSYIFLPAGGKCTGNTTPSNKDVEGHYWSRTPNGVSTIYSYALNFNNVSVWSEGLEHRTNGCSVRAVLNEGKVTQIP